MEQFPEFSFGRAFAFGDFDEVLLVQGEPF